MTATIQFGSIPMTGTVPARDGSYVVAGGFFRDWYTVSASKTEVRERPAADGAFGIDRDWRSSLVLAMEGRFRGDNWPAMLTALSKVAAQGSSVLCTVTDDMGVSSRSLQVRKFTPTPMPGAKLCYFAMDLVATDARRYGPVQQVTTGLPTVGTGQPWPQVWPAGWGTGGDPGRASATNTGGASTSPLLKVTGGLGSGVQLVEITTGSYLQLDRVIPAGSTVYFDVRTGRVYLDDPANDISGFTTRRDWAGFQIPAGGTRVIQFNGLGTVSGTPMLTVQFSPAS